MQSCGLFLALGLRISLHPGAKSPMGEAQFFNAHFWLRTSNRSVCLRGGRVPPATIAVARTPSPESCTDQSKFNPKTLKGKKENIVKKTLSAVFICAALIVATSMTALAADLDNLILNQHEVI